jgi:hypothetical protein
MRMGFPLNRYFAFLAIIVFTATISKAQQLPAKSYQVTEGKVIGIWPHNNRFQSVEGLKELKDRWGFNYLLIAAIYGSKELALASNAGFDPDHIIYQIYIPDFDQNEKNDMQKIRGMGKIWGFYFDEPISRSHSYLQFLKLISFLSNEGLYPNAKLIASELDEKKAAKLLPFVDQITYSGYGNNERMGLDQAETWREWQKIIGNKFGMPWVSAQLDSNEYRTLFKAAHDLNFNSIMFYELEPLPAGNEVSNSNIEKFCEAAVEYGFMKIKNKK